MVAVGLTLSYALPDGDIICFADRGTGISDVAVAIEGFYGTGMSTPLYMLLPIPSASGTPAAAAVESEETVKSRTVATAVGGVGVVAMIIQNLQQRRPDDRRQDETEEDEERRWWMSSDEEDNSGNRLRYSEDEEDDDDLLVRHGVTYTENPHLL